MAFTMTEVKDFDTKLTPKKPLGKMVFRAILWLAVLGLTGLLAAVLAGVILGLTGETLSLNLIASPENILVCLLTSSLTAYYHNLTKTQACRLMIFALTLALIINLIQGLIWLVLLPPVLKKLRLIETVTH